MLTSNDMRTIVILCLAILALPTLLKGQDKTSDTMKMNIEKTKLSCKLTTPELQERKRTVLAEVKGLVIERKETEKGVRYKFDGSDKMLDLLNNFIKTERLCCRFFIFNLTASSDNSFAWLELSEPEGTKDFIETEIEF